MKKRDGEDQDRVKKLIAYMDFAARVKIAQEELKKQKKQKKPNK